VTPRFARIADDGLRVTLSAPELELLRSLPDELRALYEAGDDRDPVRSRLFPRAYLDPTAEDAEKEWRELVHPELLRERLAAVELVVASLADATPQRDTLVADLTADQASAWLAVLNDARLALGTRLEVTEDTDYADFDPDDPAAPGLAAYAWLTFLQGELVETLLEGLPDDGEE
jgi:hypothetical protein